MGWTAEDRSKWGNRGGPFPESGLTIMGTCVFTLALLTVMIWLTSVI